MDKIGFLNFNKPAGFTSHDCVAKLRHILQTKRIGHGGTLDPSATGVLPIAIGKATRLLQFLPREKAYQAKIRLGVRTTTDDLEGEIIEAKSDPQLTLEEIEPILGQFVGSIAQIPPAYSAISQGGERLYKLARDGKTVEVPSRMVEINRIEVLNWYPGEYPELEVAIACGPGTYIRAIARDLGDVLGVGGTLAYLQRTLSCGLKLEDSYTFADVETGDFSLIPPEEALKHFFLVTLNSSDARRWCQGQKITLPLTTKLLTNTFVTVQSENQQFLGIGELTNFDTGKLLMPKIVFST